MWQSDPVLGAFVDVPRVIWLGPPLGAIAIRDQIVRGHVAALRASRHWSPSTGTMHALVVGAGAAGVAAAMTLVRCGHRVLLVDRGDVPFMRQVDSRGRWIDPHFYDWPACSYVERHFPVVEGAPLLYGGGWAHEIAESWSSSLFVDGDAQLLPSFRELDSDPSRLKWSPLTQLAEGGVLPQDDEVRVRLERLHADGSGVIDTVDGSFSLVVVATGFQEVRRLPTVPAYESPPYWHQSGDDWLTKPRQGRASPQRVLIVGGGDGAIQDFLRVLTGLDDHRELLTVMERCFGGSVEQCRRRLVIHDQSFWRGYAWVAEDGDERGYHATLDDVCRREAKALLNGSIGRDRWLRAIRDWRGRQEWAELGLFVRGDCFRTLFSFNRFSMWLLLALGDAELRGHGLDIRHECSVSHITPTHPPHRGKWEVSYESQSGNGRASYDHVLLRLGVQASVARSTAALARKGRLLPPHYVPKA